VPWLRHCRVRSTDNCVTALDAWPHCCKSRCSITSYAAAGRPTMRCLLTGCNVTTADHWPPIWARTVTCHVCVASVQIQSKHTAKQVTVQSPCRQVSRASLALRHTAQRSMYSTLAEQPLGPAVLLCTVTYNGTMPSTPQASNLTYPAVS
jgi:hypothetical protein